MALERVAFLPFGMLLDLYRYGIFSGATPENQWNQQYELLRLVVRFDLLKSDDLNFSLNFSFVQGKIPKDPFAR